MLAITNWQPVGIGGKNSRRAAQRGWPAFQWRGRSLARNDGGRSIAWRAPRLGEDWIIP